MTGNFKILLHPRNLFLGAAVLLLILFCALTMRVPTASAHRDGCHRWHSCPSDTGSYVCGDLGYYSECPGGDPTAVQTAPKPAPKPRIPIVTKKTITEDQAVPFKSTVKWTNKEYRGYVQARQAGQAGTNRVYTEVTYTDGIESGRAVTKTEIVTSPTEEIIVKGRRTKPTATVAKVYASERKGRINIAGTYRPDAEVVLSLDGKRIKRALTDRRGRFTFYDVKAKRDTPIVQIFKRVDGKEDKVSEKFAVHTQKHTVLSEYDHLHGKGPQRKP
jgi:hypothetical protein